MFPDDCFRRAGIVALSMTAAQARLGRLDSGR